jgi:hypothetical protein
MRGDDPALHDHQGSAAFDREAACSALPTAKARDAQATTPGIVFPPERGNTMRMMKSI